VYAADLSEHRVVHANLQRDLNSVLAELSELGQQAGVTSKMGEI
jgi:hypothetical protein